MTALRHLDFGAGEAVLLFAGVNQPAVTMRAFAHAIGKGYRVRVVEHPRSWSAPPTIDAWADAFAELLGDEPVHLVGHSLGATLAFAVALRRPLRLRSLALIEPLLHVLVREADAQAYREVIALRDGFLACAGEGRLEEARARWYETFAGAGAWARLPAARRATDEGAIRRATELWALLDGCAFPLAACAALPAPALLIDGEASPGFMRRICDVVARHAGAERVTIAGAGHFAPLSHAPAVAAHLRAHWSRAR